MMVLAFALATAVLSGPAPPDNTAAHALADRYSPVVRLQKAIAAAVVYLYFDRAAAESPGSGELPAPEPAYSQNRRS